MSLQNRKICGGCFEPIEDSRRWLACHLCKEFFDLKCAGVTERRFHGTLVGERRDAWRCVTCVSKQPKRDNTETPVRAAADGVTMRRGAATMSPTSLDASMLERDGQENPNATALNITMEVTDVQALFLEIRQLREEMRDEFRSVRAQIDTLIGRVSLCERRVDAHDERLGDIEQRLEAVESRQATISSAPGSETLAQMERTISELKLELNERDQEALVADLEIGHLPEEKGENVLHSVAVLAGRLGVALDERDVVFAERVGAPPAEAGGRARRVVVRLARRHLRDELLRAARVRRGLAGEGGARVFINERLTRSNRQLFHRVREECRRLQWRYSWTRRGRIFARKSDGAQVFQLRSLGDLERVFGSPSI
ncbi:uncharacterized protein LOC135081360 [Ostrinia nubilalis]|uniref:uncharacterized protein LOC135081360 n=1 Tax=Ostrinia nubilalis TaxID=29057 RepID=UPI00308221C3